MISVLVCEIRLKNCVHQVSVNSRKAGRRGRPSIDFDISSKTNVCS